LTAYRAPDARPNRAQVPEVAHAARHVFDRLAAPLVEHHVIHRVVDIDADSYRFKEAKSSPPLNPPAAARKPRTDAHRQR